MPSKKHISSVNLNSQGITDGVYSALVLPRKAAGTHTETLEVLADQLVTFTGGETPELTIGVATGSKLNIAVTPDAYPYASSAYFPRVSDGSLEMFVDETAKAAAAFPATPGTIAGVIDWVSGPVELPTGEVVYLNEDLDIHLSLNSVHDDMDPGETRTVRIPYTTADDQAGANVWPGFDDETEFDPVTFPNEWTPQGGGVYSFNKGNAIPTHFATIPATVENDPYLLIVTITPMTGFVPPDDGFAGTLQVWFGDVNGDLLGSKTSISMNDKPNFEVELVAPAGAVTFAFDPTNGCQGDLKIEALNLVAEAEVYYQDWLIKGPRTVGPKLVAQTGFSGTNWTPAGNEYTHTPGSVAPLTATITTIVGHIYQISCNTKNATAGSITVAEADESYSTPLNDGDVWQIRATSTSTVINYTPSSDFDGVVVDTFVRELLVEEDHAGDVLELTLTDWDESGDANLSFMMEPVAGRRSATETPDYYRTGELIQNVDSDDYGFRWDDETASAVIENATINGKRSGLSARSAGTWLEVWNVSNVGGFKNEGIIGPPLIAEDAFAGTGWTYDSWGWYNSASANNNVLSAPFTMDAGKVVHVTVRRATGSTGTIVPQLVGDTTEIGVEVLDDEGARRHEHEIYLITVPANVTAIEYLPTDYTGEVERLIVSERLKDAVSFAEDKFSVFLGTSVTKGPMFTDAYVYFSDDDGYDHPMADVNVYQTTNTDSFVYPHSFDPALSYKVNVYQIGGKGTRRSDGIVDSQIDLQLNHSSLGHAYYCLRWHTDAHHIVANTVMYRHGNSYSAMTISAGDERGLLYNCMVDDVRCTSAQQLVDFLKVGGGKQHTDKGAITSNMQEKYWHLPIHVCRSRPYMHPAARLPMTDMEFQYKLSSDGAWLTLPVPFVGLPGFLGIPTHKAKRKAMSRDFTLSPEVYDFRVRALNGPHVGAWTTLLTQVIT